MIPSVRAALDRGNRVAVSCSAVGKRPLMSADWDLAAKPDVVKAVQMVRQLGAKQ